MRTNHTLHSLPAFPVYSAAFLDDDRLVLGGGGGSTRSGIKNKLRLYNIQNDVNLSLISELELEKDEDAPMSMAADTKDKHIVCGINSSTEKLNSGINENCRIFKLGNDKFELSAVTNTLQVSEKNMEEYQKVTVLSPDLTLVAAAGSKDLSLLNYPSLSPAANALHTEHEIYDVAFSSTTMAVATTNKLLIYRVPTSVGNGVIGSPSKGKKQKQKQKLQSIKLADLEILDSIAPPSLGSNTSATFRAVRFHPLDAKIVYTCLNATGGKSKGSRMPPKQGYICRWDAETWTVSEKRKIGERGITCFDISANGKLLAYGAADYTVGILDAKTLAPLLSILKAHDFPPTVLRFNPSSTLLISGSPDNSVRAVSVPEALAGTTWTKGSVLLLTLIILLISIFLSYAFLT